MMIYLLKGETVKQIMIKGWVCRVVSKYNEILVFECITGGKMVWREITECGVASVILKQMRTRVQSVVKKQ